MYIDGSIIFLVALAILGYLYLKNRAKKQRVSERSEHLISKFQKEIGTNKRYSERVRELSKLVSDLIMLNLIKRLADSDMKRWELIQGENYKGEDTLDKWAEESQDDLVIEARQIKNLHSEVLKKLDRVEALYNEQLEDSLEKGSKEDLDDCLFNLLGTYISAEAFYVDVNKSKSINKDKLDVQQFTSQVAVLSDKLDEIINSLNDKKFGLESR